MNVKILLLILRGMGIRSSTNATICGERAGSEYVVARGGCVASAHLCSEQEKREGIAEGGDVSGIGSQVDPSPRDVLDCHLLPWKGMVEFKLYDVPALLCRRLSLPPHISFSQMSYAVSIKHAGKVYQLTLDTSQPPAAFKQSIYEACGVPPDRQKVMVKGGVLKVYQLVIELY